MMPEAEPTFLFIPDISGFTNFVNKTEIDHSKHIIKELLEIIIDSDELHLTVSEIEGDAVLFYRKGVPTVEQIIRQSEKTFLNFHNHLTKYNTERICRCGACETAANLSLKFIAHSGDVELLSVKNYRKLHGSDVILAHKLLKNQIPRKEYVLFTSGFYDELSDKKLINDFKWLQVHNGTVGIDKLKGDAYKYIPLSELLKNIKYEANITLPGLSAQKLKMDILINSPVDTLYDKLTNLDRRKEWSEEIKGIIRQDDHIYQTGSVHTCLLGDRSMDVKAIGRMENEEKIVYGERIDERGTLKDIITIYTFHKKGEKTKIELEIDFRFKYPVTGFLRFFANKKIMKRFRNNLQQLKAASEIPAA